MHPIMFRIGTFEVGTYALLALLALATLVVVFSHFAAKAGRPRMDFVEIALWAFIIGLFTSKVFGAAMAYDAADPDKWRTVYRVLRFGGHFYIGFMAGFAYLVLALRRHEVPLGRGLDWLAPGLALGHGIGRIGCFLAGCCWGGPCSGPLAVTFTSEDAHRITGVPLNVPLHPTQLYESGAELLIGTLLLVKLIKWRWRDGSTFLAYVAAYGATRFGLEFLRDDPRGIFPLLDMPTSQPLALASAVVAVAILAAWAWQARGSAASAEPAKAKRRRR